MAPTKRKSLARAHEAGGVCSDEIVLHPDPYASTEDWCHERLEVSPRWARTMVTAFARLGGKSVGAIANQPRYLGGVIDAAGAEKGARFVRT